MKISSRQFIKEAVTKPAFVESLKVKYKTDPDFIVKTQDKNGEEIIDINKDAVILINKFYGYKKLNSVNQASSDYSALIDSLPNTWREAANLMSKEIADMSADPTKTALISLGLKEEDVANKEVRAWLEDRYVKNNVSEIHPISEALGTLKEYVESKDAILSRIKTDEDFKSNLDGVGFTEDKLKNILSLSVDNMVSILSKYKHGEKTTIRTSGVEIREGERVGKVGEWNIWLPQTQETSAKIAGYDDVTKDPKTTWCTGRTKGSNLFYDYVSRGNIIYFLFYIIRDNPSDVRDWLSMGFIGDTRYGLDSIKPVYDQDGGMTIDRDNKGLSEENFREILGKNYSAIFDMMKNKIAELGGKNPATKELENYAKNLSLFKKALWNKSKEEKKDFYKIILQVGPSYEVEKFIGNHYAEENSQFFLHSFSKKQWANERREDLGNQTLVEYTGRKSAETDSRHFLEDFSNELWANKKREDLGNKNLVECARDEYAKRNPRSFLEDFSNELWANERRVELGNKTLAQYAKEKFAERQPRIFLSNFSDEKWANKKREDLGNKTFVQYARDEYAKRNPRSFLEDFSNELWANEKIEYLGNKNLVEYAKEKSAERNPHFFLKEFSYEKWANKKREELGNKTLVEYTRDEYAKRNPRSFLLDFSGEEWANKKREDLGNKTLVEYAEELISKEAQASLRTNRFRLIKLSNALRIIGLSKEATSILNLK